MQFVDCSLKKNHAFLDLSGFEVTIILLELINLEFYIEKYFKKFKGLYNLQKAITIAHKNLSDNENDNIMTVHVLISFPDRLIDMLSLDLVSMKKIFNESKLGKETEYKKTFDKLYVLEKELIKLFDKNYILPVVSPENIGMHNKETVLFDE